ncbi:MAG: HNH endonuclease [Treponema sp.]|jgi:hypothetical protein|nr:HNH endonuclease [Treponema sp.]
MRKYTPEEIRFIRENIAGRSYAGMTDLFNRHFGLRGKKKLSFGQMKGTLIRRRIGNGLSGLFLPGYTSANRKPVGTECSGGSGYVVIKTADPSVWKYKHVAIWEKAHGPVPKGHAIMFADGNKSNLRLSNLLMVSRKNIGVMNRFGLIFDHKDLTRAGKTIADIKILIAKRTKGGKSRNRRNGHDQRRTAKTVRRVRAETGRSERGCAGKPDM